MFVEIDKDAFKYLPITLNTVGCSPKQNPVSHVSGMHYHEFIWVREGKGDFVIDGKAHTLEKGEGVFIRKGTPHSYKISDGSSEFFTSWFTFSIQENMLDYLKIGAYLLFSVPPFLESEREALESHCNGKSTVFSRSASTYLLITELFAAITPISDTVENKVHIYLENHYSEPITLDMVANAANMDKYALCHYYSKKRRQSVMDELNSIRIAKAKRFLRYTTDSIADIGRMCGFESPSYFSKKFKEACKKTPAQYRASSFTQKAAQD